MKKKLVLIVWMLGLILSTGVFSVHAAPERTGDKFVRLTAPKTIKVIVAVTNKTKNMAVFGLNGTKPYFHITLYIPQGTRVTQTIEVVPGTFKAVVGFGVDHCKSAGKNVKISKSTKKLTLSIACGKFQ